MPGGARRQHRQSRRGRPAFISIYGDGAITGSSEGGRPVIFDGGANIGIATSDNRPMATILTYALQSIGKNGCHGSRRHPAIGAGGARFDRASPGQLFRGA